MSYYNNVRQKLEKALAQYLQTKLGLPDIESDAILPHMETRSPQLPRISCRCNQAVLLTPYLDGTWDCKADVMLSTDATTGSEEAHNTLEGKLADALSRGDLADKLCDEILDITCQRARMEQITMDTVDKIRRTTVSLSIHAFGKFIQ